MSSYICLTDNEMETIKNTKTGDTYNAYTSLINAKLRIRCDELHENTLNLNKKYDTLKSENADLENDVDELEKRVTNLKGFCQNLSIMNRNREEIITNYKTFKSELKELLTEQYQLTYDLVYSMFIGMFIKFVIYIALYYYDIVSTNEMFIILTINIALISYKIIYFNACAEFIENRAIYVHDNSEYKIISGKFKSNSHKYKQELNELINGNDFLMKDPLSSLIDAQ